MSDDHEYRGTQRTLGVLRAVNHENGATITRLSHATGISRPALYRILGSLEVLGYVRRRKEDGGIFLTSLVQMLSAGFRDEDLIREVATPALKDLQRQVVWPTELGFRRNYAMQLAGSTRRHSPLVIDRGRTGTEMPLLRSALGLAHLAHCPDQELDAILDYLSVHSRAPDRDLARDRDEVRRLLKEVRRRGYASRYRNSIGKSRYADLTTENATIAVPIQVDGKAVASIGITFIASALTMKQAVERHLGDLKAAQRRIERELVRRLMPATAVS